MTQNEKLSMLAAITRETDNDLLGAYLLMAGEAIMNRAYPFGAPFPHNIPERYTMLQIDIAVYLYNKRGAEGQTSHSEQGVLRNYAAARIPDNMLAEVIPMAEVIG